MPMASSSMDKFKSGLRALTAESDADSKTFNASSSSSSSSDQTQVLIRRASGRVVSLSTCSKVCAISFVVGVFVGFTLKRRLRRWASNLLKRLKD